MLREKEREGEFLFDTSSRAHSLTACRYTKNHGEFCDFGNDETCHQRADKQTGRALNCWRQIVLQTVPIPSNHTCNRIGSNYNVQRDRRQFLPCKKAEETRGSGVRGTARQFPFAPHRALACRVVSVGLSRLRRAFSPSDSFEMHCRLRKARSTRAANANPISENNFSRGRILARLFKTSDFTGSCCGAAHTPATLYSPHPPGRRRCRHPPLLFCSCRAGPFSPRHL